MSQSIVKMMGEEGRNFLLSGEDRETVMTHPGDKSCLLARAVTVTKVGGKGDGELITDGIIEQNQTVIIRPADTLIPKRYHCMVSWPVNLTLNTSRVEALQPVVRPGSNSIGIKLTTRKKLDLAEFPYILEIYLID